MRKLMVGVAAVAAVMMIGSVVAADAGTWFVGSKADVAGVQAAQHQFDAGSKVAGIHVAGDYALLQWYSEASGSNVFKRVSGEHWKEVAGGGRPVNSVSNLVQNGIPASIAKQLCSGWPKGSSPCE
jgi:hypothetical protein